MDVASSALTVFDAARSPPMDASSPFAQMPPTPEPIVARVRADLERLTTGLTTPAGLDPARLADETVRQLWDSRVRVFVPVLALRKAKERLLAGTRVTDGALARPAVEPVTTTAANAPQSAHAVWPWAGAVAVAAVGWPLGELIDRPWLGVSVAGWAGILGAMRVTTKPRG